MGSLERSCLLNDMSGNSDSTSTAVQKSITRFVLWTNNFFLDNLGSIGKYKTNKTNKLKVIREFWKNR